MNLLWQCCLFVFYSLKQGDNDARERFINGNLRLVLSVLQRFSGRCDNMV